MNGENIFDNILYIIVYSLVVLGLSVFLFFTSCTVTLAVQKNNTESHQSQEATNTSSVDSTNITLPTINR